MDFAARLRSLREKKGITQAELGRLFNLSKQAISSYERRESQPDVETLRRLADYFQCSVDYLLGRTDDPTPPEKREAAVEDQAPHKGNDPMADLPEEARKSLLEFQEFIFKKYGKKQNS